MKAKAFQIHWHNKQPIYSVDFHPQNSNKLATCGGDNNVRIWNVIPGNNDNNLGEDGPVLPSSSLKVEYLATLTKHMKSVNCVRFSPSGEFLASAGDGGFVMLWKQSDTPPLQFNKAFGDDSDDDEDDTDRKEFWNVVHQFRAMDGEDVYDIAWSPNGTFIILGLTDNTAQIWDIQLAKCVKVLKDHQHFVQGVAWDPLGQFLVTQSSDRSAKVWIMKPNSKGVMNYYSLAKYSKISSTDGDQPDETDSGNQPSYSIFHDETLVSFFRRPAFSPDGSIVCFPTGQRTPLTPNSTQHGIYINFRNNLHNPPGAFIGGFEKAVIAVRFNPLLFPLLQDGPEPFVCLPYRMIFALVTQNSVYIFDTQNRSPIFMFANLHYASLTDVTWSSDGVKLVASSVDGFCTVSEFDAKKDFGSEPLSKAEGDKIVGDISEKVKAAPFFNSIQKKTILQNNIINANHNNALPSLSSDIDMEDRENEDDSKCTDENKITENVTIEKNELKELNVPIVHNPPVKRRITPTLLSKE